MDICVFRSFFHLCFRRARTSPEDIFAYRPRKKENILRHNADVFAQRRERIAAYVAAVDGYASSAYLIKSRYRMAYRRFSASGGTDERHGFPALYIEADAGEHIPAFVAV